jgi:CheY-like chemotaxis protein
VLIKMAPVTDMTREIVAKQLGDTTMAEEALARAHDFLAESMRAKAELMAQMGHEIRTPLNGVVGTTELLLGTELSDEQREIANATMTSATTLMVVVNDVLDFAMLEAGQLELDVGAFEIRHLVDGLALGAQTRAGSSSVSIDTEFGSDVPSAVSADGNRIRHVLTKLVATAVSLSSAGELTVRLSATSHSADRTMLRFEVIDRNASLDGYPLESLFDPYASANGPGLQDERANGIGLAVCRQLVELMGGEIGVESGSEGTIFWFTTPVGVDGAIPYPQDRIRPAPASAPAPAASADLEAPKRPKSASKSAAHAGLRILIADDDPVSRLVLTRQLEARGFAVEAATNGREVLELFKPDTFGAVFMDCQMPEINGFDATVAIREREDGETRTPIVAMTASARESDREQCHLSGMDDYVPKPLDQVSLDAALARRIPTFDEPPRANEDGDRDAVAEAALLENSLLTDVFRHNSESRGYLIGVFVVETRARIAQLAAAETGADAVDIERLAHAVKGSARTVGAKRLEEICAAVQELANEGRLADANDLHGTLEHCFELTAELLQRGCPEAQTASAPSS